MSLTVGELVQQPQLRLTVLAGHAGLERAVEWAHSCDLPDPWSWVGPRQALLTNGGSIPLTAADQVECARKLSQIGVVAIGVGDQMGAPQLAPELLQACDELALPLFTVPYPLPFIAVAKAVAASTALSQTRRVRMASRLYEFAGRDLLTTTDEVALLSTVGSLIDHDVAVVDAHCLHPWFRGVPTPDWLVGARPRRGSPRSDIAALWESQLEPRIHAVPLAGTIDAMALFRPRRASVADQSSLLHAAAVLSASVSRRAMDQVQSNRLHVEYLNRIMVEQNRFGFESDGWMRQLGYRGPVRGVVLVGESREDRELVVGRLQRHGVKLSATVQRERHVLVAQHEHLPEMLRHTLPPGVRVGLGAEAALDRTHQSIKEAVWAVLSETAQPEDTIAEFSASHEWMGFRSPADGEDFLRRTLGPLLDQTPAHRDLLQTLRVYLEADRSPQRAAEVLSVHRQTVIQRLHRIEALLKVRIADTETISKLWLAVRIHGGGHRDQP